MPKITIEYIAGFFDADGSVSLIKTKKRGHKAPQVSFHNNKLCILKSIKDYFGFGVISKKKPRKPTHSASYDLKMTHRRAISVLEEIYPLIRHPTKKHRASLIISEYLEITNRQGHYNGEDLIAKYDFEDRFFATPLDQ